jgi:hypothetical protein
VKIAAVPKPSHVSTPKPVTHHVSTAKRKTTSATVVCYVGRPCDLSKATWTVTHGCTRAWLAAMRRAHPAAGAQCPAGSPPVEH